MLSKLSIKAKMNIVTLLLVIVGGAFIILNLLGFKSDLWLIADIILLAGGVLTAYIINRSIVDSIDAVKRQIHYIADSGDLSKPIVGTSNGEIAQIVDVVNELLSSLARNTKLLDEYKKAVDVSAIVSKTDINGSITFANDKFCEISGYSEVELLGKSHNIVRHPDMPKSAFGEMWETILSKQVWRGIVKNRAKDGSPYVVQAVITPILNEQGEIEEFIGVRYDITEFERLKDDLQNRLGGAERDFKDMLEMASQYEAAIEDVNIVTKTDINGTIIFANDKFCTLSGYDKEALIGRSHNIIRHGDTPAAVFKDMWRTIKGGNTWKGLIKNRSKDGSPFWIDTTILPIFVNQELVEYMMVAHNITNTMLLHQELEDTQRELIYRMGEIGETRNKETGNHVKRVAEYSKLLASKYGLDKQDCELIFIASTMHDIGKVAIPDAILLKPSTLSVEEFEVIKTHAPLGASVLSGSKSNILQAAAIIAGQHHEKYNGNGYPQGLSGDNIHIFGRIVAVADVFDALGAQRPYKKAWELDAILELFRAERGGHFDPMLVDIFLKNLDEFLEIRARYE